jgi:heme/copper-type cytochrome/quinol oxidase subunit 3
MTYAAFLLAAFQIPFVVNLFRNWRALTARNPGTGTRVPDAPFASRISDPGSRLRPDTGTTSGRLGMWLFLASEAMFFASLFSGYVMLRAGSVTWPDRFQGFPWLETVLLVGASATFGASRFRLIGSHALAVAFVAIKIGNDVLMIRNGSAPASNVMLANWYALTWVHALHVFGGAIFTGWLAGPSFRMLDDQRERWLARIEATRKYWLFVDLVWLAIVIGFFFI